MTAVLTLNTLQRDFPKARLANHTIHVNCTPEEFYTVVSDYESYPDFVPSQRSATILTRDNSGPIDRFTVQMELALVKQIRYQLRAEGVPGQSLTWSLVDGDFMEGVVILGIVVGIVGVLVFGLRTAARRAFPDIAQDIDQEKTLAKGASKDLFQLRRALKNRSLEREKLLKKGVRRFGWEALAKDVRRIVANPNEYEGLRVVAVRLFAQHDPAPVDALGTIADNRHETLKMRQLACQLLGERGGTDIERHLLRALRQGDPDSPNGDLKLRRQLLEILAVHGTARAKDLILQVWADHEGVEAG